MSSDDPFDLQRFIDAQNPIYADVCDELRRGRKTSHWMWFIFPQIQGLGHSPMATKFAISSLEEAKAYLRHSVLRDRLLECTELVNQVQGRSIHQIFGYPDDMKFRSSMTLFAQADPGVTAFSNAIAKYFGGKSDRATLDLLII
jgi:uncharacterized protein (DUF1810 family)